MKLLWMLKFNLGFVSENACLGLTGKTAARAHLFSLCTCVHTFYVCAGVCTGMYTHREAKEQTLVSDSGRLPISFNELELTS